jgi:hypothetical protein
MSAFELSLDSWGRLVLIDASGQSHTGIEVVRAFPITDPGHGISLVDSQGSELVWIANLDALAPSTRATLEEELCRREFMPHLQRVVRVSGVAEPTEWEVETDRGSTRFILNSEDDVRRLGDGQALLIDASGVRYLIPPLDRLDPHSRRILERYL